MKKIGLMLSGGGARGAYQVGVIKALMETGIMKKITHISGTSIGAINTYLLMNFKDYDTIYDYWKTVLNNDVIYYKKDLRRRNNKNSILDLSLMQRKSTAFLNKNKSDKFLKQGYCVVSESRSKNDFITKKNKVKRVIDLNKNPKSYKFVQASGSIPIIFGHTKIDNLYYFDGGLIDNYPIKPLIEQGCNIIFSVGLLDFNFKLADYDYSNCLIIDLYKGNIISKGLFNYVFSIFDFSSDKVEKNINAAYKNTMKVIKYLKENNIISETNVIKHSKKAGFKLYRAKDILKIKKGKNL